VDILARTLIENNELPIGIFTAIVGAPFFAFIIIRKDYQVKE
jgi:iron complex transport system permease protein